MAVCMTRPNRWIDESLPYRRAEVDRRLRALVEASSLPRPLCGVALESGPFGPADRALGFPTARSPSPRPTTSPTPAFAMAPSPWRRWTTPELAYLDLLPAGVVMHDEYERRGGD